MTEGKDQYGRPPARDPEPLPGTAFDGHCHLDLLPGPLTDVLARAAAVGISRVITVGCDLPSSYWAVTCAADHPEVGAAVAIHPNETSRVAATPAERDAVLAEIAELAVLPRVLAVGETGLDYYWDDAPAKVQQEWFRAHIAIAKQAGKPLMIHDRDAHEDVLDILAAEGAPEQVIFHCFSGDAAMAARCAEAGYVLSFAGTLTFANAAQLREAAAVIPAELVLVETDAPFLTPVPNRGKSNSPAQVAHTLRALAAIKELDVAELCAIIEATGERVFGPWPGGRPGVSVRLAVAELAAGDLLGPTEIRALAARLDLQPAKHLGQNFVVDAGTVTRIAAQARLAPGDVVLEVGPGFGSLTLPLLAEADRVGDGRVLAVEIDPVLAAELPVTVAARAPELAPRLTVLRADAARVGELPGDPPTALVANLPYNVAVPVVLHLLATFGSLRRGLVMVQAEVADRMTAPPGSRVYGIPSAKLAWYADVRRAGSVPRGVFWPVPRVDSGLVAFTVREPPAGRSAADREQVFAVIDAAFSQRRKTLRAALAGWAGSAALAERAVRAAGIDPGLRGEALGIDEFARIAAARSAA